MKIKAAVFDLDGLLIDSEPLWQIAEVEVLNSLGVPLTAEMCHQTVGLRIDEAIAYWFERYPWTGPGVNEVADIVVDQMLRLIRDHARGLGAGGVPRWHQGTHCGRDIIPQHPCGSRHPQPGPAGHGPVTAFRPGSRTWQTAPRGVSERRQPPWR